MISLVDDPGHREKIMALREAYDDYPGGWSKPNQTWEGGAEI